jgi:hypothetical protein
MDDDISLLLSANSDFSHHSTSSTSSTIFQEERHRKKPLWPNKMAPVVTTQKNNIEILSCSGNHPTINASVQKNKRQISSPNASSDDEEYFQVPTKIETVSPQKKARVSGNKSATSHNHQTDTPPVPFFGKIYTRKSNSTLENYEDQYVAAGKAPEICSFPDCLTINFKMQQCMECLTTSRIKLRTRFCDMHADHFGLHNHLKIFQTHGCWINILFMSVPLMTAFKLDYRISCENFAPRLHRAGICPSTFFNGLDSVQDIADEVLRQLASFENDEKTEKGLAASGN